MNVNTRIFSFFLLVIIITIILLFSSMIANNSLSLWRDIRSRESKALPEISSCFKWGGSHPTEPLNPKQSFSDKLVKEGGKLRNPASVISSHLSRERVVRWGRLRRKESVADVRRWLKERSRVRMEGGTIFNLWNEERWYVNVVKPYIPYLSIISIYHISHISIIYHLSSIYRLFYVPLILEIAIA